MTVFAIGVGKTCSGRTGCLLRPWICCTCVLWSTFCHPYLTENIGLRLELPDFQSWNKGDFFHCSRHSRKFAVLPRFWDDHVGDLSPPFASPSHRSFPFPSPPAFPFLTLFSFPLLPLWPLSSLPFSSLMPNTHYTPARRRCVLDFRSTDPLHPARGSVRARRYPLAGSGAEPQPKSNLVHFSLKTWHLVATILLSARDVGDFSDAVCEREMAPKCGSLPRNGGDLVGLSLSVVAVHSKPLFTVQCSLCIVRKYINY